MLTMKILRHPDTDEAIETLWELFPDGDAGTFIFHSAGVTIDFKRVGDEYFYEMKEGKLRVAFAKERINRSLIAHIDQEYYTFAQGRATSVWGF